VGKNRSETTTLLLLSLYMVMRMLISLVTLSITKWLRHVVTGV